MCESVCICVCVCCLDFACVCVYDIVWASLLNIAGMDRTQFSPMTAWNKCLQTCANVWQTCINTDNMQSVLHVIIWAVFVSLAKHCVVTPQQAQLEQEKPLSMHLCFLEASVTLCSYHIGKSETAGWQINAIRKRWEHFQLNAKWSDQFLSTVLLLLVLLQNWFL